MNKLLRAFFALDIWIALSLITTLIVNIFFAHDKALMITISILCALVNLIFASLAIKSMNFYKNSAIKKIN